MSRRPLLPVPLLLAIGACVPELPEEKPDEGNTAGDCTDRADNDDDGAFDCDDDGCAASPDCTADPAPPEGLAVAITPAAPGDDDALSCAIVTEAVDPNGDVVSYAFAWTVDGEDAGNSGESVAAGVTVPGQTWTCTVTPSDGTLTGTPATASVTIQRENAAPSAPVVAITPAEPTDDDALSCAVVTESVDPDGDAVTYAYAWTVDGTDAGVTVASVDAARTSAGQTWTCSVTASDGSASSGAGSASVVVRGCDADGDGHASTSCGGDDCDDSSVEVFPRAGDRHGDAVDADCDDLDCEAAWIGSVYFAACPGTEEPAAARARCEGAGYDGLAEFNDASEQSAFVSLIATVASHYWIGLERSGAGWGWASGAPLAYTNWAPLEPSGDGACAMQWGPNGIPYANQWNDVPCTGKTADGGEGIGAACMVR